MAAQPPTLDNTTRDFLSLLWRGGTWAYYYFIDEERTYTTPEGEVENVKESVWFPVGKLMKLPNKPTAHYYFGVNPTTVKRNERQRAVMESVAAIGCVFAEYDLKDWQSREAILDFIATLPRRPSVLIDSGGGYHAYWLLQEPFIIATDDDRQRARSLCRRWVRLCEGDDVKDLTRVLRLPGTRNIKPKYGPDYPMVSYVWCDLAVRYELTDLEALLPPDEDERKVQTARKREDTYRASLNGQGSIIDWYNERVPVEEALESVGYIKRGKRYCAPNADRSVNSSVVILDDNTSYHWDTGDELCDEHTHTAFDIYCHYNHKGDPKAAVKAIIETFDLAAKPTFDARGVALCPKHGTPLPPAKNGNGYKCHAKDDSSPTGWCVFWWKGEGYTPPAETKPTTNATNSDKDTKTTKEPTKEPPATVYTAAPSLPMDINDLLALERKPVMWYAPSFIREGLGLLVGQPQVGKTPLAAQLAIAVSTGGKWLNTVQCRRAKVLYLGMEYSPQELIPLFDISRMGQTIPRDCLSVKTIEDEFPTTPDEAIEQLEWYMRVLDYRVIIIDVLTAFLPPEKFKQNVYRGDYSELKPYHKLALKYNASIVGVWHASKREADPKLMYNGSTGMWAAAASRMAMYQDQEQRVRIASFPRMGDKLDWALTQEKNSTGRRWVMADAEPEPVCSPTELTIYRFLKEHADKATPKGPQTIADMVGLPVNTIKVTLRRMLEKNLIQQPRTGTGYYVETVEMPAAMPESSQDTEVTEVTEESPYSVDGIKRGGTVVWRVWDDRTGDVVKELPTESEAYQYAQWLLQPPSA